MSNHANPARVLLLGAVLATLSTPALATHSWGGYHWAFKSTPFNLQVVDNMTDTWDPHLSTAVDNWNKPLGKSQLWLKPFLAKGSAGKRNCSMVVGTTQVCNAKYGYNGWLGLASINITGGAHITQGSAKMNDSYFNLATYNNKNERLHVVCQEVAHTFGLGHQSETGESLDTCMDYFSNTGVNSTSTRSTIPNEHDFQQLESIYGSVHGDSYNSALQSGAPALASSGVDISDDPRSWGTLIHQSANGRSSIYERRNSNGSKTLTHVYWAEETAAGCRGCDHRFETHQQH